MCSAYYQAMKAFKVEDKIKEPHEEFNNEELRYNHRFNVFQTFNTPPMCQYIQFKEKDYQFTNALTLDKIYMNAQQHFEKAKTYYEDLNEWNSVRIYYF